MCKGGSTLFRRVEKGPNGGENIIAVTADHRGGGEGTEEDAAVALLDHPAVEDEDDAAVVAVADEAAEALLETQDRLGDGVGAERVAAGSFDGLGAGFENRFRRHLEGETGDDDLFQRSPRHIDPFPEGVGGEEDAGRVGGKVFEQTVAALVPLAQAVVAAGLQARRQFGVDPAQQGVGGEEDEGAAVGGDDGTLAQFADRLGVARRPRFGDAGGDGEEGLAGKVEGGVEEDYPFKTKKRIVCVICT